LIAGSVAALILAAVAGSLRLLPPRPSELNTRDPADSLPAYTAPQGQPPVEPGLVETDEITHDLREVWRLAAAIEAGLHHSKNSTQDDPVSAMAHRIAQQAQALEREMAPLAHANH
jgi:hypothetical protein